MTIRVEISRYTIVLDEEVMESTDRVRITESSTSNDSIHNGADSDFDAGKLDTSDGSNGGCAMIEPEAKNETKPRKTKVTLERKIAVPRKHRTTHYDDDGGFRPTGRKTHTGRNACRESSPVCNIKERGLQAPHKVKSSQVELHPQDTRPQRANRRREPEPLRCIIL